VRAGLSQCCHRARDSGPSQRGRRSEDEPKLGGPAHPPRAGRPGSTARRRRADAS
jgi:hypothetical protein